ncbi:hypothetical protein ACF08N_09435 [Streptomyces sp. NPDC015127]|uniref:hypothetical protein n=1 Tax=Streptomyces sp. NPDC015127 TaxID=3364939 RepID=UPI0036FEF2AC
MTLRIKQAAVALGIVAAATLAPLASPTSAAAAVGYTRCLQSLADDGYIVGPKVQDACSHKATKLGFTWVANQTCVNKLVAIRVDGVDALSACERAHS